MGLVVPIGRLLRDGYFTPEDITLLTAVFAETLEHLRLTDRNDPAVTLVAKRIIEFAWQGERDRAMLRATVLKSFRDISGGSEGATKPA